MYDGTETDGPQIRFIRDALTREFSDLIDLSDCAALPEANREQVFLSRALAARAARLLADVDSAEAADCVTDGRDDRGIDAIAFSRETPEIWLIHAKWSYRGRARLATADILKLIEGLNRLTELQYDKFNPRFQRLAERVDKVLLSPGCKIHLVVAVAGDGHLSADVSSLLSDAASAYNELGDIVDSQVLDIADFHSAILSETAPPPIDLALTFTGGFHLATQPHVSYTGMVSAAEPADWYAQFGARLYEDNIRRYLGPTSVNRAISATLAEDPQTFGYYNNGITVLCDSVSAAPLFSGRRPARLTLHNARVVNGAQTITSIAHAHQNDPDAVAQACVLVRVIRVGDADKGLAARITAAGNAQNRVESRDFIALDSKQAFIRADFRVSLGKDYVYRRGALAPVGEAGCTVDEAATALACAHPDATLVARLRSDSSSLWDPAPDGGYARLFEPRPPAREIWRAVQLVRKVNESLHATAPGLGGHAAAVCDRGSLLVAHVVFRAVGPIDTDEPGAEWEDRMASVPELTHRVLLHLAHAVQALFSRHTFLNSVFASPVRCRDLAAAVLHSLHTGQDSFPEPEVPARRLRRPNSVPLLVAHERILDGTQVVYRPGPTEESTLGAWLNADPRRFLATWVNDTRRPLVWAADGKQYSPTGLVRLIWDQAEWREAPVAVAGASRWLVPGEGTLDELARELFEISHGSEASESPETDDRDGR
ncbi:AIPR family protein [Streptomyces sp. RerS4]|uniref:AIPR family protein n=1 Tax=Streptomyces sp. RerS4 TaxID=2942449 RepID=UPI00201C0BFE|nr:AIPR family protein [Streptomyces sp. RerS4]UQX04042.1 AIPR family protein [Streptomyces sp. RerS4]